MKQKFLITFIIATIFTVGLFVSCASGPAVIPDDISAMELIQRGQEASDRNRFNQALEYYAAVLQRFPFDIDSICAAEYEIAFIHYKQGRYDVARNLFNNLLERYNTPDAALLPQQFRVLSHIVLARIDEAEERRRN